VSERAEDERQPKRRRKRKGPTSTSRVPLLIAATGSKGKVDERRKSDRRFLFKLNGARAGF
jgi:hypothetical protein